MYCDYSSSRARNTETAAKNAERKADNALREIGEMRGMLTEAFGKLNGTLDAMMQRLDTLEEAIVNPKSEAAEKLAKKYGAGKGRSTTLKHAGKPGGGA